jgi:hypothetical protein
LLTAFIAKLAALEIAAGKSFFKAFQQGEVQTRADRFWRQIRKNVDSETASDCLTSICLR